MKERLSIIIVAFSLSSGLLGRISPDNLLGWMNEEKKTIIKYFTFNKLKFAYEEAQVSCAKTDVDLLLCRIGQRAHMVFDKKAISSSKAVPLVRLARKQEWQKQYRLINQYVEGEIVTGLGKLFLQKALVYHLDNIQWPVLIRAYDVVIDEHTCISIMTKCDFRDCPAVEKEIARIEASLSRTARY